MIPETLRAHGRIVDDVAAYKTVVRRDPEIAAAARTTDAWTFTSASTVDGLAANLPDLGVAARGRVIVAIGPITAQSLRRYGLEADAVAGRATVEGLVTTLEALFARRER